MYVIQNVKYGKNEPDGKTWIMTGQRKKEKRAMLDRGVEEKLGCSQLDIFYNFI